MNVANVVEMLKLQDQINRQIDERWIDADYPWARAIFVEAAELMEHVGWKWWKHQETDFDQAVLELVDIWHFVLSQAMVVSNGDLQKAARDILDRWARPDEHFKVDEGDKVVLFRDLPLQRRIELFGGVSAINKAAMISGFKNLCEEFGVDADKLTRLYIGKNALNALRQANGYKTGTYQKIWNGREDNVVLMEIVGSMELAEITYTNVLSRLEKAYAALQP